MILFMIMEWKTFFAISILVLQDSTFMLVTGNCEFTINQESFNEPLLLRKKTNKNSYELIPQESCKLRIHSNQSLLVACPGNGNFLNYTKNSVDIVKCQQGNKFEINGNTVLINTLICNARPHADLKITGKKCFKNNGDIIQTGFKVGDDWHAVLEICHDTQKGHTYYAKHTIIIPASSCDKTPMTRPGFIEAGLYSDLKMDEIYSIQHQFSLFEELFGSNIANDYINREDNKYLARGHLAPDADFPLDAWQSVTYFYVNTAPQWQSINGGNWKSLENEIRKVSTKIGRVDVITGTYGTLKLEKKDIYLENKKVPVPEYFWKLIRNPAKNSCMGFIVKNNQFLKRSSGHICQDVCSRYGWNIGSGKLSSGHVYCCEYHQLSRQIQEVPSVRCTSALRYLE